LPGSTHHEHPFLRKGTSMAARKHITRSGWIKEPRFCIRCDSQYLPMQPSQKYCNKLCSNAAIKEKRDTLISQKIVEPRCCANPSCGIQLPKKRLCNILIKYCCDKCQRAASEFRRYGCRKPRRVPTGTLGAISELIICADLMKRGYHVFRALNPACPCDLLILLNGKTFRIEVTSGYRSDNGTLVWSKHNIDLYDVLALVMPDGEIVYNGLDDPIPPVVKSEPGGAGDSSEELGDALGGKDDHSLGAEMIAGLAKMNDALEAGVPLGECAIVRNATLSGKDAGSGENESSR
jgi:hypothetical protein